MFDWFNSLRPINNLSVMEGRVFLGWTSSKLGLMCLTQGHNAVTPVRLEPAAPRSRVKHIQWATALPYIICTCTWYLFCSEFLLFLRLAFLFVCFWLLVLIFLFHPHTNNVFGLQTLWWFRLKDLSIDEMVGAWSFGCLSGPLGFTCWISFAPVFSLIYCWVLILALSPCYILIYMF